MYIIKLKNGTLTLVNHLSSNVNTDHSFMEDLLDNGSHYSSYLSAITQNVCGVRSFNLSWEFYSSDSGETVNDFLN